MPSLTRPPTPDTSASNPPFASSVSSVRSELVTESWRSGCPVPLRHLRLVTLRHWTFDRSIREGTLIVHRDSVAAIRRVFRTLFEARFPIERMELVDRYGADDDRSMAANNTSAFNCRRVTDSTTRWSQHAYGRAIDINPVQNPYVASATDVRPPAGRAYLNRVDVRPGMIVRGDVVVRAFAAVGWSWGGDFRSAKDPQHFSGRGG